MEAFLNDILKRLQEVFDPAALSESAVETLINLMVAALTFGAFYLAWFILQFPLQAFIRSTSLWAAILT